MEIEKQRLMISALVANRDLLAICGGIVKPSYFDPSLKKSVKFLIEYFAKYKDVPKFEIVRAETGLVLEDIGRISKQETKYVSDEIEVFCRNKAIEEAILQGPELLSKGDHSAILRVMKDAITVGLQRDLGLNYFENPYERLRSTIENRTVYSTGWSELDNMLGGGLARQELLMFLANSGGGKSMTMLNVAKNLLAQGLNGVYISLEMAEGVVSKRLDSMISKIGQDNLLKQLQQVASLIENASSKMGQFYVKRMPENRTNISHVHSYLQQLEQATGFSPDFIVVDYIDIMGTTAPIQMDNLFVRDKFVTEEIRSLGFDYNCMVISAAQLGRGAIDAEKLNQSHIQGGISKINTSDYAVAVKQDDLMRAAGEISFECLKTRNSGMVNTKSLLRWDPVSLCVSSLNSSAPKLVMAKKQSVLSSSATIFQTPKGGDDDLLNLMNITNP